MWSQAEATAQTFGTGVHLVSIGSAAEEAFLTNTFGLTEWFWIGLSDAQQEGTFTWVDGTAITYTNWGPAQPDDYPDYPGNTSGGEDYVFMNWNDFGAVPPQWNDNFEFPLRGIVEASAGNHPPIGPLLASVIANPDGVKPGQRVMYEVVVANVGTSDLTGVQVQAVTPNDLSFYYLDTVPTPDNGGEFHAGDPVVWTLGTLLAGQVRTVTVPALVGSPADGTPVQYEAQVVANGGWSGWASRSVLVDRTPVLRVAMDEEIDPVAPGGLLTYRVAFGNVSGDVAPGAVLRVGIPGGTEFVGASDGGTTNAAGAVEWDLGLLSAGESGQRELSVRVDGALVDGMIIEASAELKGVGNPNTRTRAETIAAVASSSRLALFMSAGNGVAVAGQTILFSLVVSNSGVTHLAGVVLKAVTPNYLTYYRSDALPPPDGGGTYTAGDVATWSLGTLLIGEVRLIRIPANIGQGPNGTLIRYPAVVAHTASLDSHAREVT